jgi:TetR/AcrR family transcriptional repressor of nem operon
MNLDTRSLILMEAEFLIRTRGYSAFSYADLAERVAITKASIHYHFPSKEDLITVLVRNYLGRFTATLEAIRQQHAEAGTRLHAYAHLFLEGFEHGMLPLCGALSAERSALPESMLPQVQAFFQIHLDWLAGVLEDGRAAGALRRDLAPDAAGLLLLSTLEGGTFVGWALARKDLVLAAFQAALQTMEISGASTGQRESAVVND